jgi:hypothetical protein
MKGAAAPALAPAQARARLAGTIQRNTRLI